MRATLLPEGLLGREESKGEPSRESVINNALHEIHQGLNAASSAGVPPGSIMAFGGATTPPGWLQCSGAAVRRADFKALFAAIGTLWGEGDGSTTFNIPSLNGTSDATRRFLRGSNGNYGTLGGSTTHTHTTINNTGSSGSSFTALGPPMGQATHLPPFANVRYIIKT